MYKFLGLVAMRKKTLLQALKIHADDEIENQTVNSLPIVKQATSLLEYSIQPLACSLSYIAWATCPYAA